MLENLAVLIDDDPECRTLVLEGKVDQCNPEILQACDCILDQFADLAWEKGRLDRGSIFKIALQMSSVRVKKKSGKVQNAAVLERRFLVRCARAQVPDARDLLDLARASYRLRDDDNIYLGRIEGQLLASAEEGSRRIKARAGGSRRAQKNDALHAVVLAESSLPAKKRSASGTSGAKGFSLRSRQIVGQPAGPGIAMGKARVIFNPSDLYNFQRGEILVCDAIDPGMTFIVPLAAAVVERRGGMLIHGAIIAREYGLPCVTGVPDAADRIKTGDFVTVDGHLGIVTVGEATLLG